MEATRDIVDVQRVKEAHLEAIQRSQQNRLQVLEQKFARSVQDARAQHEVSNSFGNDLDILCLLPEGSHAGPDKAAGSGVEIRDAVEAGS